MICLEMEGETLRRLFRTLLILLILYLSWPLIDKQLQKTDFYPIVENVQSELQSLKESPEVNEALQSLYSAITEITGKMENAAELLPNKQDETELNHVTKPDLAVPDSQTFAVHNLTLGEKRTAVEQQLGQPKRSTYNEYGVKWDAYHDQYHNFVMVAYDDHNNALGLYTNQDLISSSKGIKLGTSKETALQQLGEPLNEIRKGLVYFRFEKDRDYDVFMIDDSYVTIFYDKHIDNTVTAIQIIEKDLEQSKKGFYAEGTPQLKEGFELQLFDLTNADRVKHGLSVLTWDDQIKETARKHSLDMAENNYFSHTNLDGESPFDRMKEDDIFFTVAGENLAYGQFSSIFAHEGLMNSLGHRENILRKEYNTLGVGVAFNSQKQPFYTENFIR